MHVCIHESKSPGDFLADYINVYTHFDYNFIQVLMYH